MLIDLPYVFDKQCWEEFGRERGLDGVFLQAIFSHFVLYKGFPMHVAFGAVEEFIEHGKVPSIVGPHR